MSTNTAKEAPKKRRFAPKAPPRKLVKAEVKKEEPDEADNAAALTRSLLRHNFSDTKPKFERKAAPVQVAFGSGGGPSQFTEYGLRNSINALERKPKVEEVYEEPWDYYGYYPVTLPMRRPHSGNPERLNEEEFINVPKTSTYDENSTNPALELGILEENPEPSLLFLQLPSKMPMVKRSASANIKEGTKPQIREKICQLSELPPGFMGKMLVYKSGAVKLKLGETLYNVSSGVDCLFTQDVVAVNTEEKHCCSVGEVSRRAIVIPDIDSVLKNMSLD